MFSHIFDEFKDCEQTPCYLDPVCRYRYKPGGPGHGLTAGLQPHLRQRIQVRQVRPVTAPDSNSFNLGPGSDPV